MGIDIARRSLPRGFDVVLLSNILHGHGSSENKILLRKVRESLKPEGRLLLRDVFMHNDATAPEWGALFSVLMLLNSPRGRSYTLDEILGWLRAAGFSRIEGSVPSSPLPLDPDSLLIARA
jgi:hypothetical protein